MGAGREGESGHVTPNDSVKPGDLVFVKDPFGIGKFCDDDLVYLFSSTGVVAFTRTRTLAHVCCRVPLNLFDFLRICRCVGRLWCFLVVLFAQCSI